jgi:hypothetical protein
MYIHMQLQIDYLMTKNFTLALLTTKD